MRGAAEGADAELADLVAVEGDADVLEVQRAPCGASLHMISIASWSPEVVGALDGVEGVGFPAVVLVERGVDPALRGVGVRAHGVDLGDDPHGHALLRRGERSTLAGEASAYD